MQLCNVHTIYGDGPIDIAVQGRQIVASATAEKTGLQLTFTDAMVFPGLINSHDHLDFNLFPPLGNRAYNNYRQWGQDIHAHNKADIDAVQRIPKALRAQWGVYKNLLGGVTTVVNHGDTLSLPKDLPIHVFQDCYCLHSVGFDDNWRTALRRPFRKRRPFVIHIGEGKDALSEKEIDELIAANRWKRTLVGVHGVAMTEAQAAHFKALVWCPASNIFLLGQTAAVDDLYGHTEIVFGTDSTLTASWNIWQHLRLARQQELLTDAAIFDALTVHAAAVWGLKNTGQLQPGFVADIVVAKAKGKTGMDAFFSIDPQDILLVMHQGRIGLFDESLLGQLNKQGFSVDGYGKVKIADSIKYIQGPVVELMAQIKQYHPAASFFPASNIAAWTS